MAAGVAQAGGRELADLVREHPWIREFAVKGVPVRNCNQVRKALLVGLVCRGSAVDRDCAPVIDGGMALPLAINGVFDDHGKMRRCRTHMLSKVPGRQLQRSAQQAG